MGVFHSGPGVKDERLKEVLRAAVRIWNFPGVVPQNENEAPALITNGSKTTSATVS